MLRVMCHLTDCAWFHKPKEPNAKPGECDCGHTDKAMYLKNKTCPLYRKEWTKLGTEDLKARFARKKFGG